MQNMINPNLNRIIFLKRKHKLYKTLSQNITHEDVDDQKSQINIINLYEFILNKEHHVHHIDYYIKHEFSCNMNKYGKRLIELIWNLKSYRQNHVISFIYYRLSRKYPFLYWDVHQFIQRQMHHHLPTNKEQISIMTDLFLYGFPLTQDEFLEAIFPSFKHFILQMVPKYLNPLQNNEAFSLKSQKIIKTSFQAWIQVQKETIIQQRNMLKLKSITLQDNIIKEKCSQLQQNKYQSQLQQYQTNVYHLGIAFQCINSKFDPQPFKLKSIFQLKKESLTFKSNFQPSQYEKSLYFSLNKQLINIQSIKKSQMLKIQEHEVYINQIKYCSNINQCIKLSGFFIEQLNIQYNREQLIEIIINQCYYYDNISYIIRILRQICQVQVQIKDYCQLKAKKICNQSKMNHKYQKIICQMTRFQLIDEAIILDYAQKILKCENNLVTKEVESLLQQLGTIVYYRSLQTHIRINNLFERMQSIIKNKMIHFSIQNLFHLKSILNFLRNYKNIDKISANQITKIQIKTNFKFILKKMQTLLKNQEFKNIQQYITQGINQQDFLNIYQYSFLIKQLNSKDLNQLIYNKTISVIFECISSGNLQNGVKWSRFLGQLYSYEIINRKKLIDSLNSILNKKEQNNQLVHKIKFISSALQTSKVYLLDSEKNKENKFITFFLFQLKKILLANQSLQMMAHCQISDIMQFFHPYLPKIKNLEEINAIESIQATQSSQRKSTFHNNLYYYLDLLQSGIDVKDLTKQQVNQRFKYKQKYIQKPVKYIEKNSENKKDKSIPKDFEAGSEQSHKTSETIQPKIKKVIKVIGRDKNTKAIRIMTYNHSEQTI